MAQGAGTVDSSFGAMFDRNVMLSLSKVDEDWESSTAMAWSNTGRWPGIHLYWSPARGGYSFLVSEFSFCVFKRYWVFYPINFHCFPYSASAVKTTCTS